MQTARMPECSLTELERTAETYSDPKKTLEYSKTPKAARAKTPMPWSLLPCVLGIVLFIGGYYVLEWLPWKFSSDIETKVHRYLLGAIGILAVLGFERALEIFVINRARNPVSRFNLKRVARLAMALVLAFIVVSVLFVNWYAAVVSL